MTSLVHIGDFHAAPGPRRDDQYRALDQIISEGLALPALGAWLWPGDLFDALSTTEDRNALDARLQRMADAAPVILCYGNHDKPGDLDGFARLHTTNGIYVIDAPHTLRLRLPTRDWLSVFVLPYPSKAGLVGAGVAPGAVVETAGDLLEPIFMQAAAELERARDAGDLTLMIGHVNVAGSIVSSGQPNIGREIELNPRHLERLGPIYKGLNHIHKPQIIAGAYYAGSVCRLDYGETEEKFWLEIVVDDNRAYDVRPHQIAIAPMFRIEGRLTADAFTWELPAGQDVPHSGAAIDWTGCDVRVRYTYKASERAVLKPERIHAEFAGALRLKVEGIAEPDRELRAPEVAAAKTLPAKLAAYRHEATLAPSLANKLEALEQVDVVALLSVVAQAVKDVEQGERATVAA